MTYPKLICLLALLPIILSRPTPPIPTDPGIEIEVSTNGLDAASALIQPSVVDLTEPTPVKFELDSRTYEGTFDIPKYPQVELKPIPNDRTPKSYDDFESIDGDSSSDDDRFKRDTSKGHAKVLWEDKDFLAGKQLGGLETTLKSFDIKFDLKRSGETVEIVGTDVTLKVSTILGQDDGQIRQARIAAELDGELDVKVEGRVVPLSDEAKNDYFEKILELIVKRYHHEFDKEVTQFTQAIGSKQLEHFIFDFRLIDHPEFTEDGFKAKLVGKFVYDKENKYKYSVIPELESQLGLKAYLDTFKTKSPQPVTIGSDGYTKTFSIVDTTETPNVDTLKGKIVPSEETEKLKHTAFKVTINEDFLNSAVQTLIESGYLDYSFTQEKLGFLLTLTGFDLGHEPSGDLRVKIEPVEGHKYFRFTEGKLVEHFKISIVYDGKAATYEAVSESHLLFGHSELTSDITKLVITKKADSGFPELLSEETLKSFYQDYYGDLKGKISENKDFDVFTQIALTDKHLTIGINVEGL